MEEKKVSNSRLWVQKGGVLLGGCGITGTYSLYNSLASIFYTDVLGISATAMGVMVFISKVRRHTHLCVLRADVHRT